MKGFQTKRLYHVNIWNALLEDRIKSIFLKEKSPHEFVLSSPGEQRKERTTQRNNAPIDWHHTTHIKESTFLKLISDHLPKLPVDTQRNGYGGFCFAPCARYIFRNKKLKSDPFINHLEWSINPRRSLLQDIRPDSLNRQRPHAYLNSSLI